MTQCTNPQVFKCQLCWGLGALVVVTGILLAHPLHILPIPLPLPALAGALGLYPGSSSWVSPGCSAQNPSLAPAPEETGQGEAVGTGA